MRKKRILSVLLGAALLMGAVPAYAEEPETVAPVSTSEDEESEGEEGADAAPVMELSVKELCQICDTAEGQEILELGEMPGLKAETRASIEQVISQITDKQYDVSFLLLDLQTGQGYSKNPEEVYFGASSIKGPYVAALAERVVDAGEASLTDQLERDSAEFNDGSGTIKDDPAGTTYTLEEVMTRTIVYSDNMGYDILREEYGADFFGKWLNGGSVETSYAGKQWPSYDARTLTKMWVSIYEYFQSGRGISEEVKGMFDHSEGSVITQALGDTYTVYAKPGYTGTSSNQAWHDAALVMSGDHPYLMTIMTNIPWSSQDDTYGDLLAELAGYLDQAHTEVFPVPTEEPEEAEPVSVSQVPQETEEEAGKVPVFVWVILVLILGGGGFLGYRVWTIRKERELQRQQWEAARRRRRNRQ
ncbi:MAG TPA: serine hydrolase [Candidatus Egerieimonas intestinavium]|uniref:Serine hydrolase n=1 Tax=Candidatus Egerieimonas intestinavium TaxID=2840777 RepID=A0A9D1JFG4_9FIRM|nr:serine hydrolase [Candidatus Egerieimonas intestinavium]